jgi:Domain of unknown function (DUF2017)
VGEPRLFVPTRDGGVTVRVWVDQRLAVAHLLDEVAQLLVTETTPDDEPEPAPILPAPSSGPDDAWTVFEAALRVQPPDDPALARLLPDGHREDGELAQSYRRLTERSLRSHKRDAATEAAAALRRPDPVVMTAAEARSLLTSLADARLVLAERLGVRTEEDSEQLWHELERVEDELSSLPEDDPQWDWARAVATYEALAWWQQQLITALPMGSSERTGGSAPPGH